MDSLSKSTWTPIDSSSSTSLDPKDRLEMALKYRKEQIEEAKERRNEEFQKFQMMQMMQNMQHQRNQESRDNRRDFTTAYKEAYNQYWDWVKSERAERQKMADAAVKALSKEGGLSAQEQSHLRAQGGVTSAFLKGVELLKRHQVSSPEQLEAVIAVNKESTKEIYSRLDPEGQMFVHQRLQEYAMLPPEQKQQAEQSSIRDVDYIGSVLYGQSMVKSGARPEAIMAIYQKVMSGAPDYNPEAARSWALNQVQGMYGGVPGGMGTSSGGGSTSGQGGRQGASIRPKMTISGYIQDSSGKVTYAPAAGASAEERALVEEVNRAVAKKPTAQFSKTYGDMDNRKRALDYFQKFLPGALKSISSAPPSEVNPQPQIFSQVPMSKKKKPDIGWNETTETDPYKIPHDPGTRVIVN